MLRSALALAIMSLLACTDEPDPYGAYAISVSGPVVTLFGEEEWPSDVEFEWPGSIEVVVAGHGELDEPTCYDDVCWAPGFATVDGEEVEVGLRPEGDAVWLQLWTRDPGARPVDPGDCTSFGASNLFLEVRLAGGEANGWATAALQCVVEDGDRRELHHYYGGGDLVASGPRVGDAGD